MYIMLYIKCKAKPAADRQKLSTSRRKCSDQGSKWGKEVPVWTYSPSLLLSIPSPSSFHPSPSPNQLGFWGSTVSSPTAGIGAKHVCDILTMHLVATKLPLRHTGMAVITKNWRYGFKQAKEVPEYHTTLNHPTSSTGSVHKAFCPQHWNYKRAHNKASMHSLYTQQEHKVHNVKDSNNSNQILVKSN